MAAARRGRRVHAVLALLLASLLAPIVLYSVTPASPFSGPILTRRAFDRDASNRIARSEVAVRLNALRQDSLDVVKEPVEMVASDASLDNGEHKDRVLSETDGGRGVDHESGSSDVGVERKDGVIEQVVSREDGLDEFSEMGQRKKVEVQNGEEMEETKSHDTSEVEHKDKLVVAAKGGAHLRKERGTSSGGSGEVGENSIAGKHNAQGLRFSLKKENTADRSSEQTRHATSKESDIRASNSNAGLSNTYSHGSHSTAAPDAMLHIIKDQLIKAKAYLGIVSSRGNHGLDKELRAHMRDLQRALSDATSDRHLSKNVQRKMRAMEQMLAKLKQGHDNCSPVINRLRATLRSTEEQLEAHKKEAKYLAQIAAKALPRWLHCLPLRLTNEYYSTRSDKKHFPNEEKLGDHKLYHYALFSDNVLAAAVVVNSTLVHAKKPANHVFHIVTNKLNYNAMRMWFLANPLGKAAIQVQNIEEFRWLNSSYSPVLKQLESQSMIDYYFRTRQAKPDENLKFRNPKYLSMLNHLRFYLPEIFPKLNKVLFLDDDTVVQEDLSTLWLIDLKGKVNGAVETCGETFHRFDRYLNFSNPLIANNFKPRACGWAYGMNMFDLAKWRKQNITDVYHSWQNLNEKRQLWKLGTLPAGLATFWNRTFPLKRSWHLLGLGYNPNVDEKDIERAAVIHYNGNLKPWLEIGLPKYHKYWSKYINFDQVFLRECNVNS